MEAGVSHNGAHEAGDGKVREKDDFYPTPTECTWGLIKKLSALGVMEPAQTVWECACGAGDLARVLEEAGHTVIGTDLVDRGYGRGDSDFLLEPRIECDWIITNPPFCFANEFIERACTHGAAVAMIFKGTFWHAGYRVDLFRRTKPSYIFPLSWRPIMKPGGGKNPVMEFAWTVWLPGQEGLPQVDIIRKVGL